MIPYGLIRGKVNQNISISIMDVSIYGFTFRLVEECSIDTIDLQIELNDHTHLLHLVPAYIEIEERNEYYIVYRIEIENEEYISVIKQLMKEYKDMVIFKQSGKDLVQDHTDPIIHYIDFSSFDSIGVVVDDVDRYLEDPHYLSRYPFQVNYLYIGSQTCIHLLPEVEKVNQLTFKHIVLMLPPIKTSELDWIDHYLSKINREIEVVVNDLGTLQLVQKYSFHITLGILMIKHRKDPRVKYLPYQLKEDRINWDMMKYDQEVFHVERFSYECSEEKVELNQQFDLYLPYYITNVSTYCSLYSYCVYGSTYSGVRVEKCPGYCKKEKMIYDNKYCLKQKGNSIVAYDHKSISDLEYIKYFKAGRIVINDEDYGWNEFN